eukprot:gene2904-1886_t
MVYYGFGCVAFAGGLFGLLFVWVQDVRVCLIGLIDDLLDVDRLYFVVALLFIRSIVGNALSKYCVCLITACFADKNSCFLTYLGFYMYLITVIAGPGCDMSLFGCNLLFTINDEVITCLWVYVVLIRTVSFEVAVLFALAMHLLEHCRTMLTHCFGWLWIVTLRLIVKRMTCEF